MKINCASVIIKAFSCAALALVAACSPPQVVPTSPPPPPPRPTLPPPPPPPVNAFKDWRDAPQTPGDWRYEPRDQSGVARFGSAANTLFMIACNRSAGTVSLIRSGTSTVSLPMSVATTSEIRALSAEPASAGQPQLIATLPAHDAVLDAMAFSRGRFALEVNGLPTLHLPAWAEVGRVIEDCRGR
ncbi:MAG: hypothetical protein B7Y89_11930 [Novosphingobium sp. 32-60-15]|uniref:hypothetical protein n=1 Tax=unclassified Novosphingobium TaxID=2644732 RepID=UPI000BD3F033|nr:MULTISPECIES: hypothetical protein [unclassified Novosphingobium]OYX61735.1 MAG: hypothetical protein B7Y89_11930 [Novosphingobium sp. 32-60-15]